MRIDVLQAAIAAVPCGVVVTDPKLEDNPIVYANPAYLALSGYELDEVIGRNPRFMHGDDRNQQGLDELRQAIMSGAPCRTTIRNKRKDETTYFCDVVITPVFDGTGQLTNWVGIQNDITAEVLLRQQQEDWIATLMHDLEMPLLGANRVLELLMHGEFGALDKAQSHLIGELKKNTVSLLGTVGKLLSVYKFLHEKPFLTSKVFDIAKLIRACVEMLSENAESRRIELNAVVPDEPINIDGTEDAIYSVVFSLLDNAVKFTPTGGTVRVCVERGVDVAIVEVSDTGPGIPVEAQGFLFDRFWRGVPGKKYVPGTGLGLYLCKQVVHAHGGSIVLKSRQDAGSGSTFTVSLPLA